MRRGFTLIELLVVVGIMGLMGTITVGGYRQMQQGLAESSVMDTMEKFLSLAKERALIDRKPTAVYCWNELLREETDDEPAILVGRAVAIRMKGRISGVYSNWICDEFGDLEQYTANGTYDDAPTKKLPTRLYNCDSISQMRGGITYSLVRDIPQTRTGKADEGVTEFYMTAGIIKDGQGDENGNKGGNTSANATKLSKAEGADGLIIRYGYYLEDPGTASWKVGSIYGLEFQSVELPHGFVFGTSVPTSMGSPVKDVKTLVYEPDKNSTDGITISAYKPGQSGSMTAVQIGTAKPSTISRR